MFSCMSNCTSGGYLKGQRRVVQEDIIQVNNNISNTISMTSGSYKKDLMKKRSIRHVAYECACLSLNVNHRTSPLSSLIISKYFILVAQPLCTKSSHEIGMCTLEPFSI